MVRRPKSVTNIAIPNGISAIGHVKTFSGALLKAVKRAKPQNYCAGIAFLA